MVAARHEADEQHEDAVMRRMLLTLSIALCALVFQRPAGAATPELQITPRVGAGSLLVHEFVGINKNEVDTSTYGIGASIGFLTPIGVVAEIGADTFGDFDFFESFNSFRLSQEFGSIGYQFDLGNDWRLVPRVGRAHWKLRSQEGRLFNPGPEEVREVRGWDYFWEVGVAHRISQVVALGVNYKQGQYNFGRTRSVAFTVTLGFGSETR
jgi:hypothetical protein